MGRKSSKAAPSQAFTAGSNGAGPSSGTAQEQGADEITEQLSALGIAEAAQGGQEFRPPAWMGLADTPLERRPICHGCRKVEPTGVRFLACAQCRHKYYCSKECQRAQWPTHKLTCKNVPQAQTTDPDKQLDEHYRRWRKRFFTALTCLVHTVLTPAKCRTHVLFITAAYHRGDRPGFEIQSCKASPIAELRTESPELWRSLQIDRGEMDQLGRDIVQQEGLDTVYGTIVTLVRYEDEEARTVNGGLICSTSSYFLYPSLPMPASTEECISWINRVSRS